MENQFNSLHLSNFSHISSYCQQLKSLKDQLANIDQLVSEQKLVLCMVSGLVNTDFDTVASMIQQMDPLLSFETARSRLLLEEARRAQKLLGKQQSFVVQSTMHPHPNTSPSPTQPPSGDGTGGGGRTDDRGRGGKNNRKGRGRGKGKQQHQQGNHSSFSQQAPIPPQGNYWPNNQA